MATMAADFDKRSSAKRTEGSDTYIYIRIWPECLLDDEGTRMSGGVAAGPHLMASLCAVNQVGWRFSLQIG